MAGVYRERISERVGDTSLNLLELVSKLSLRGWPGLEFYEAPAIAGPGLPYSPAPVTRKMF